MCRKHTHNFVSLFGTIFLILSCCSALRPQPLHPFFQLFISPQICWLTIVTSFWSLAPSCVLLSPAAPLSIRKKAQCTLKCTMSVFAFFFCSPLIHSPISKTKPSLLCLFVLVFNSFLTSSLFSHFFSANGLISFYPGAQQINRYCIMAKTGKAPLCP